MLSVVWYTYWYSKSFFSWRRGRRMNFIGSYELRSEPSVNAPPAARLLPGGESLLFYLRVVIYAASWLAAGRWLAPHPALGRRAVRAQSALLPALSSPTPLPAAPPRSQTRTQTRSRVAVASVQPVDFTWTREAAEQNQPDNASWLHYALPQVITTFALF